MKNTLRTLGDIAHCDLKPQTIALNRLTYLHDIKLIDLKILKIKVEVSKSNLMIACGICITNTASVKSSRVMSTCLFHILIN
jgi:hypothetical protein